MSHRGSGLQLRPRTMCSVTSDYSIYFGLDMLPASPESLCLFMELMLTQAHGHCKNVLSSVKYMHTATGYDFPVDKFGLEATLQGIKRRLKGTPQFVLAIDLVILRLIYSKIDISNTQDLALWCSFLTAFFCLFRESKVVPKEVILKLI